MILISGILIEIISVSSFIYFTRKIKSSYFRIFGVSLFAFFMAIIIYWSHIELGIKDGNHVLVPTTFILFWSVFGIAIAQLFFWVVELKK